MNCPEKKCLLIWPKVSSTPAPYIFQCSPADVSWIAKKKRFYFSVDSCLRGMPPIPPLIMCVGMSGRKKRVGRFKAVGARYVGIGHMKRDGNVSGTHDSVFIAVDLARISKSEYEMLSNNGVKLSRGRKAIPRLKISDFAENEFDESVISHWLTHPVEREESPSAEAVRSLLPDDLIAVCKERNVSDARHPFLMDFQMNKRLLPDFEQDFSFIDLFAGIGGFRMAMQQERGRCLFASEIDRSACRTYRKNFGVQPFGDITKVETKAMIPEHFDILCAGFPCQAFSMAGLRKGFDDDLQRGTLYRQVVEIARDHQPKAVFCENVKGLLSSAGGRAMKTITREIEGAGYHIVFSGILNSRDYGVPQNRERLYIVALRNDLFEVAQVRGLGFPPKPDPIPGNVFRTIGDIREAGPVLKSYYIGQSYLETLVRHRQRHAEAPGGSGFGYIVRTDDQIAATLMCGGMGRERNMLCDENQPNWEPTPRMKGGMNREHLRFMTVREWARLQGFPDYFEVPRSIQAGYRQFGNCVTVKTIRAVGRAILNLIVQCEEE